jgi:hypothetical protein
MREGMLSGGSIRSRRSCGRETDSIKERISSELVPDRPNWSVASVYDLLPMKARRDSTGSSKAER